MASGALESPIGKGTQVRTAVQQRPVRKSVYRIVSVIAFLAIWQAIGSSTNPLLFSTPWAVLTALYTLAADGPLIGELLNTLKVFAAGFSLSVLFGIPIGLLMGASRKWEYALDPYVNGLQSTPKIALIPIILIWFGLGFTARIVIVFLGGIFSIVVTTLEGAKSVSRQYADVANSFCATPYQTYKYVLIPACVPFMMAGLRIGAARAMIGVIVAEMTLSITGLGGLLITYGNQFKTANVLAIIVVVSAIGAAVQSLVGAIGRKYSPWRETAGTEA